MNNAAEPRLRRSRAASRSPRSACRRILFPPAALGARARRRGVRRGHRARQLAERRADEKRAAAARARARRGARRVRAERTVYLDNKVRSGAPATRSSRRLRGSPTHVLVNRGWIAGRATREPLPEVPTPAGEVRIEGLALERLPPRVPETDRKNSGKVRQSLDVEGICRGDRAQARAARDRAAFRPCPTASRATGRRTMPASRSTRPMRCSGIRSPRSPSCSSSCSRSARREPLSEQAALGRAGVRGAARPRHGGLSAALVAGRAVELRRATSADARPASSRCAEMGARDVRRRGVRCALRAEALLTCARCAAPRART